MGNTWDPDLVREMGRITGQEARALRLHKRLCANSGCSPATNDGDASRILTVKIRISFRDLASKW
jgi:hypothetical protein